MAKNKLTFHGLQAEQHLIAKAKRFGEAFCIGYTDGKRDVKLNGWYLRADLKKQD